MPWGVRVRFLFLLLFLTGCTTGGVLDFSGEPFPQPEGHAKLCAEQPAHPACPGGQQ